MNDQAGASNPKTTHGMAAEEAVADESPAPRPEASPDVGLSTLASLSGGESAAGGSSGAEDGAEGAPTPPAKRSFSERDGAAEEDENSGADRRGGGNAATVQRRQPDAAQLRRGEEGGGGGGPPSEALPNVTVVRSLDMETPTTFPQKLMEILSAPENAEIISWLHHGRGFVVRQKRKFASDVLPRYFPRGTKYTSFTRKLNRWGFQRVRRGPECGAYYHELFRRDRPALCGRMTCYSGIRTPASSSAAVVAGAPFDAAVAGMLQRAPFNSPFNAPRQFNLNGAAGMGVPSSPVFAPSPNVPVPVPSLQAQRAVPSSQNRLSFPMQMQMQTQHQPTSPTQATEADLRRRILQLQTLSRAKQAETEAVRQAMAMGTSMGRPPSSAVGGGGSGSQSVIYHQNSLSPSLTPPATAAKGMGPGAAGAGVVTMSEESAARPAPHGMSPALMALFERQAAQIEMLRRKAAGGVGGLDMQQPQMPLEQGRGGSQRSDAAAKHKRYRASAA